MGGAALEIIAFAGLAAASGAVGFGAGKVIAGPERAASAAGAEGAASSAGFTAPWAPQVQHYGAAPGENRDAQLAQAQAGAVADAYAQAQANADEMQRRRQRLAEMQADEAQREAQAEYVRQSAAAANAPSGSRRPPPLLGG